MAASLSFQQAVTNGSAASPLAFTCASAAGQERLVALCGIAQSPITSSGFTSVTIDGQAATQVGSTIKIADSGGNGPIVAFFRAPGTSGTSINVAFTKVGTFFDARGALWTLSDAGTLLATNSDTGAGSGNLGDANLNVNTVADGAVAAIVLAYASGTRATTWTGLTERFDGSFLYSGDWFSVADLNAGSASTPLTVTATLPTNFDGGSAFASLAVSFNPAAGGTSLTAAAGSYALTGSAATFAYKQSAAAGSYALTGTDATFAIASGSFTLFCGSGSYALTGADAAFPGYEPITPPVQPATGGGYVGAWSGPKRRKRKRDEIEELIDLVIAQSAQQIPQIPQIPQPPPPALVDLAPKMQAVGLTPPQRKIVKRAIVSDDPDDDDEAIELLLNLLS